METKTKKAAERPADRGVFPIGCSGTSQDRDTLTSIAYLAGVPVSFLVRLCVNAALKDVISGFDVQVREDTASFVERIVSAPPETRRRGRKVQK